MANDADQQDVGEENRQAQKPGDTCGFILIDSDSDNDTLKSKASARQPHAGSKQPNSTPGVAAAAAPRAPPPERFHFKFEQRYNYDLSEETALEMQERLFREAAAKMRSQASVRVTSADLTDSTFLIKTPIFDVADRFPDHWTWKDPYSVLGLPLNSSAQLVKSQFRRLARTYHPDKSADMNTSAKFHSIASAYHKLSGHF